MKFCKDCKHYHEIIVGTHVAARLCKRRTPSHDLVTGAQMPDRYDCHFERAYGWSFSRLENLCGREGRFFEPKEDKP